MNRFSPRSSTVTAALAACALAATTALAGCSSGQISQTATQQASVNGAAATLGNIALRNVHLRAQLSSDYVQPGAEVELLFVASNESPEQPDKLVSVTSDFGSVTLSGDTTLAPNGVLVVGEPDGQIAPLEAAETAEAAKAMVDLSKPITNGLTYDFTFTFQNAGKTTVAVPISAGESPRREAQEAGDTGGHR